MVRKYTFDPIDGPLDPEAMVGHDIHVCEEFDVDIDRDGQTVLACRECGEEPDDMAELLDEMRAQEG